MVLITKDNVAYPIVAHLLDVLVEQKKINSDTDFCMKEVGIEVDVDIVVAALDILSFDLNCYRENYLLS